MVKLPVTMVKDKIAYLKNLRPKGLLKFKKVFLFKINLVLAIVLILVAFILGRAVNSTTLNANVLKTNLNYSQSFEDLKVNTTQAQVTSSIKVGSTSAPAPDNKKYLILFTTIENASTSAKQVSYGDWFRLEQDNKKLAPLPLNSTFIVPPMASLEKQLVFIVDNGKKNFDLLVGPIDKPQQTSPINFH